MLWLLGLDGKPTSLTVKALDCSHCILERARVWSVQKWKNRACVHMIIRPFCHKILAILLPLLFAGKS